jgi:hypothetical protein
LIKWDVLYRWFSSSRPAAAQQAKKYLQIFTPMRQPEQV